MTETQLWGPFPLLPPTLLEPPDTCHKQALLSMASVHWPLPRLFPLPGMPVLTSFPFPSLVTSRLTFKSQFPLRGLLQVPAPGLALVLSPRALCRAQSPPQAAVYVQCVLVRTHISSSRLLPAHPDSCWLLRTNTRQLSPAPSPVLSYGQLEIGTVEIFTVNATNHGIFVCLFVPREPVSQHITGHSCLLTHPLPSLTWQSLGAAPAVHLPSTQSPPRAHTQHDAGA